MLIIALSFLLVFLFLLCIVLSYKLYQYSIIIINTETAIEESLDILNEKYESIAKILEKEVFFDSIEVRQVINDIKASHDAIYDVAEKMIGDKKINEEESQN